MKITFSRGMTFLCIIEMTALLPIAYITEEWPTKTFMICWMIFWSFIELSNVRLKKIRHKTESKNKLIEAISKELEKGKSAGEREKVFDFIKEIKDVF
jgi:hypothetical protein